jgi:hypothetical protein
MRLTPKPSCSRPGSVRAQNGITAYRDAAGSGGRSARVCTQAWVRSEQAAPHPPEKRPEMSCSCRLHPYRRHNRPISARVAAWAEVDFGEAPVTLLSHLGEPNARDITDAAPIAPIEPHPSSKSVSNEKRNIALSRGRQAHHSQHWPVNSGYSDKGGRGGDAARRAAPRKLPDMCP